MLNEFFPSEKMWQYVRKYCIKNRDRRKSYHEKVCLVRKFQNVWIPFPCYSAWIKSMEMHALKAE